VKATRDSLYAAIEVCRPGACLTDIGAAIEDVADAEGFSSVRKYRGHGISSEFHCAPFVRHYRNSDRLELKAGMIFTIEPMLTQWREECFEWDDDWTVATADGGIAAQFEHTVLITDDGVEILTEPE
jgi:methionyl aminopeptidase